MEHSNSKKKDYCIVKEEPNQEGGFTLFRYGFPGIYPKLMPKDPSAVGLYASPMRSPPMSRGLGSPQMSSYEIARSVGQVVGKKSDITKTLPGRVLGSHLPGTITYPNRPFMAIAPGLMSPCASPCNSPKSPCDPCDDKPKVGVIGPRDPCKPFGPTLMGPFRKGDPKPGVWPLFHLPTYGVTPSQSGTMVLIIEDKRYKVTLPYGKVGKVNSIIAEKATSYPRYSFRFGMLVQTSNPFSWHGRVSYNDIQVVKKVFDELSSDSSVKFEHESTGKEISKEEVREDIDAYIKKLEDKKKEEQAKGEDKKAEGKAKTEEGKAKTDEEATKKKELEEQIAKLQKELAEIPKELKKGE